MPQPGLLFPARVALLALAVTVSAPARADFAQPPEPSQPLTVTADPRAPGRAEREPRWEPRPAPSTFRLHVGPALLLHSGGPGLATALDVGRRAVGARLSGSWLRAETDGGLSSYSAELWIDLRRSAMGPLHPILGAGASLLRGGALQHRSAGAGVLRGALEYELPLGEEGGDADARLGLSVMALVPAIDSERSRPWVVTTLMVGAGF